MTFNASYAEILGRELQRDRLREARKERLIRTATLANPPTARKIWLILKTRWQVFWNEWVRPRKTYPEGRLPG